MTIKLGSSLPLKCLPSMYLYVKYLVQNLHSDRKVLLLGSGFVTKPTVQILSDAGIYVTVGPL